MPVSHQDIVFGEEDQDLALVVPEGRPSSITNVNIHLWSASDTADSEWTVSSTSIDAVDTTFDDNSGVSSANTKLLNLAATTSIVADREYLATDAQGIKEWVLVSGITAGASVTSILGLGRDYVNGDTFEGTRITTTVDATWIADAANINTGLTTFDRWRVRWEYVVGGVTYVRTTTFSVVRRAAQHTVTPPSIALLYPSLYNSAPTDFRHERLQFIIDKAYEEFATDLLQVTIPDEQVLSPKVVNEMVEFKTAVLIGRDRAMATGDELTLTIANDTYMRRFQSIFGAPSEIKVPVGTDTTGGGDKRAPSTMSTR